MREETGMRTSTNRAPGQQFPSLCHPLHKGLKTLHFKSDSDLQRVIQRRRESQPLVPFSLTQSPEVSMCPSRSEMWTYFTYPPAHSHSIMDSNDPLSQQALAHLFVNSCAGHPHRTEGPLSASLTMSLSTWQEIHRTDT